MTLSPIRPTILAITNSHELIYLMEDISRQHNLQAVTMLLFTGNHVYGNRRKTKSIKFREFKVADKEGSQDRSREQPDAWPSVISVSSWVPRYALRSFP